jgi:hypothetical protein
MEQHIEKQLKKVKHALFERCQKNPWGDDMEFVITREESMGSEDFDALLSKELNAWKEALEDGRSCWAGVMIYTIEWNIRHDSGDSEGMPLEWDLYVEWSMDGFENPFYEYED